MTVRVNSLAWQDTTDQTNPIAPYVVNFQTDPVWEFTTLGSWQSQTVVPGGVTIDNSNGSASVLVQVGPTTTQVDPLSRLDVPLPARNTLVTIKSGGAYSIPIEFFVRNSVPNWGAVQNILAAATAAASMSGLISCLATGTDAIALSPINSNVSITTYNDYQAFIFQAAGSNATSTVTIAVAGLAALPVYNASGGALVPNTFAPNIVYIVAYDAALNGGGGGFQIVSQSKLNFPNPYVLKFYQPGLVPANLPLIFDQFDIPVTFPANFGTASSGASSHAASLVNATLSATFSVLKCPAASDPTVGGNWSSVGTVVFAAGGHSASFSTTGSASVSFAAGDYIQIQGPGTSDATLSYVSISLAGDR